MVREALFELQCSGLVVSLDCDYISRVEIRELRDMALMNKLKVPKFSVVCDFYREKVGFFP